MAIKLAKFKDVANGLQPGQFGVGERDKITSLDDLDPIYRQLLDKPYACTMAVIGADGRPGLTTCGSTTRATRSSSTWRHTARRPGGSA
ncbi:MAG: hypothetical protein ACKO1X_05240, partial [Acidimicrobiales bacterium]